MNKKFLIGSIAVFAMVIGLNGFTSEEPGSSFFVESDNIAFAETGGGGGGGKSCKTKETWYCITPEGSAIYNKRWA